jgi:hypothetical protein
VTTSLVLATGPSPTAVQLSAVSKHLAEAIDQLHRAVLAGLADLEPAPRSEEALHTADSQ